MYLVYTVSRPIPKLVDTTVKPAVRFIDGKSRYTASQITSATATDSSVLTVALKSACTLAASSAASMAARLWPAKRLASSPPLP